VNPISHWIELAALKGKRRPSKSALYAEPVLRFEVFDHNTLFKDVFVGQMCLSPQQIVKILADGDSEARAYPLHPRMAMGTMRLTIAQTGHWKTGMTHIVVKVETCTKLGRVDSSSGSDPYIAAFWDSRPLGQSPVVHGDSNPHWINCIFNFPLIEISNILTEGQGPSARDIPKALGTKTLLIQVRDYDRLGEHSILGELELGGDAIHQLVRRSNAATKKMTPQPGTLTSVVLPQTKHSLNIAATGSWIAEVFLRSCRSFSPVKHHSASFPNSSSLLKLATLKSVSVKQLKEVRFAPALDMPLALSNTHNGSKRVQGSLGIRLIYHTRGKVIRGVDVGVQQMSLGERARLIVRSDYGFDTVRPGPKLPPGSELEIIVDLVGIAGYTSWIAHAHRALDGKACMFRCIYLLLACLYRCCLHGEKKRREKREALEAEREAAILARAESSVSYIHGHQEAATKRDIADVETCPANPVDDLMDFDEDLAGEAARNQHRLDIARARTLFSRR